MVGKTDIGARELKREVRLKKKKIDVARTFIHATVIPRISPLSFPQLPSLSTTLPSPASQHTSDTRYRYPVALSYLDYTHTLECGVFFIRP